MNYLEIFLDKICSLQEKVVCPCNNNNILFRLVNGYGLLYINSRFQLCIVMPEQQLRNLKITGLLAQQKSCHQNM